MSAAGVAVGSVPGPRQAAGSLPMDSAKSGVGCVLADQDLRPLYVDDYSLRVLMYPDVEASASAVDLQQRLRGVLGAERYTSDSSSAVSFVSGRRRYLCRSLPLRSCRESAGAPTVALLLEREHRAWATALSDASRRYNLSQRETETVRYLVHGLTTKEIALRMNVSPNTIKQFVRLIMSKMGATTRAGIVGKISLT